MNLYETMVEYGIDEILTPHGEFNLIDAMATDDPLMYEDCDYLDGMIYMDGWECPTLF